MKKYAYRLNKDCDWSKEYSTYEECINQAMVIKVLENRELEEIEIIERETRKVKLPEIEGWLKCLVKYF